MSPEEKADRCGGCGERGRVKEPLKVRGQDRLYCHDEEKSCYYYMVNFHGTS